MGLLQKFCDAFAGQPRRPRGSPAPAREEYAQVQPPGRLARFFNLPQPAVFNPETLLHPYGDTWTLPLDDVPVYLPGGREPEPGSYDPIRDQEDLFLSRTGALDQMRLITVPVLTTGPMAGMPLEVSGNNILLLARVGTDQGAIVESSDTARILIRVNSERNPWLAFSFQFAQGGSQKSDVLAFTGPIARLWVYVQNATQDPNQPNLYLLVTRASILTGGFAAGAFTAPVQAPAAAPAGSTSTSGGVGGTSGGVGGGAGGAGGAGGGGGAGSGGTLGGGRGPVPL